MKKISVLVNAYVSTLTEIEVEDDFNFSDENAVSELAHNSNVIINLQDNAADCIEENAEVVSVQDENGNYLVDNN